MIQELTGRVIQADTHEELITGAFRTLFECLKFDVAITVMVEQVLDLYVLTRSNAQHLVSDALIEDLREQLKEILPGMFSSSEVRGRLDVSELAPRELPAGAALDSAHAVLEYERHPLGLVVLYRAGEPFTEEEQNILKIFCTQVALLIRNLRAREEIRSLADTDDLTGVANRRALKHYLAREIDRARVYDVPLSVLMIDIDDFKQINDTFGHGLGDYVLSELCAILRSAIRQPDLIGRYGGDEFIIVLPHTDVMGARYVAERIVERAREIPVDYENAQVLCAVSIGIAEFDPLTDADADQLTRRADAKLYEAKRAGKNQFMS
jgi:diguanylate cyclase (GGDEF)-like protein